MADKLAAYQESLTKKYSHLVGQKLVPDETEPAPANVMACLLISSSPLTPAASSCFSFLLYSISFSFLSFFFMVC